MIKTLFATCLAALFLSTTAIGVELRNIGSPQQFVPTAEKAAATSPEDWTPFQPIAPADDGTVILRQKVEVVLAEGEVIHAPLAIGVRLLGVYDFFWDGELIGSNRHRGKDANQFSRVFLPIQSLTPGHHVLEIRMTALGRKKGDELELFAQPAAVKSDFFGVHHTVISTFFVATASLLVGCYLVFLWRGGAMRPGLKAAVVISFSIFLFIMIEESKFLLAYPYLWQPWLDLLRTPLALTIFTLLAWVTLTRLSVSNRLSWMLIVPAMLGLSLIEIGSLSHDIRAFGLLLIALLGVSLLAWRQGTKRALLFTVGFSAGLFALWLDPSEKHLFLIVVTLLLATDLGLDIRRQAEAAAHHALVSERLRADLIKRNIQPHFLMNSLTALMEWVETAPESAIEFIDGLAAEFRLLCDFAERSVISLEEELTLCNTHLRLMALRLDSRLELRTHGIDPTAKIPPATFHTLLENAFSHNAYSGQDIVFDLTFRQKDGVGTYVLSVPTNATHPTSVGAGIGSRYVRARLEEFCGNAFRFHAEQVGSHWRTTIEIGVPE